MHLSRNSLSDHDALFVGFAIGTHHQPPFAGKVLITAHLAIVKLDDAVGIDGHVHLTIFDDIEQVTCLSGLCDVRVGEALHYRVGKDFLRAILEGDSCTINP